MKQEITKRSALIKYISKYGFKSTRINGSHEIYKSPNYKFNFPVTCGKTVKKALFWSFKTLIKDVNQKIKK